MNDHAVNNFEADYYPEPERTSLAAIFGFILSIGGCCFGVTALLGVPFSIVGLFNCGRSNGRVGGKGFAIAGLLIGLLNLAVFGGCLGTVTFGVKAAINQFGDQTARALTSIESGQFDGARANLISPAADVSDAEMIAFREAYTASLGNFQSMPDGIFDYFEQVLSLGPIMQAASGQQNVVPVPATFDGGPALILIKIDKNGNGVSSLTIIDMNGDEYSLPMQGTFDPNPGDLSTDSEPIDDSPTTDQTEEEEEEESP